MLTTFDVPRFNTTCTARVRSNTPLQSLTMANDEAMFEMARALGIQLADSPGSEEARLKLAFERTLARSPTPFELERLGAYLEQQRQEFHSAPDDARRVAGRMEAELEWAVEGAAWTAVARVLFNLDEFIIRE
jgi:hypothetical protein